MLQFRKICAGSCAKSNFEDAQMQLTCCPDDISGKLLERFQLDFVGSAWPLGTGDVGQEFAKLSASHAERCAFDSVGIKTIAVDEDKALAELERETSDVRRFRVCDLFCALTEKSGTCPAPSFNFLCSCCWTTTWTTTCSVGSL